jgi:hypothetical protein
MASVMVFSFRSVCVRVSGWWRPYPIRQSRQTDREDEARADDQRKPQPIPPFFSHESDPTPSKACFPYFFGKKSQNLWIRGTCVMRGNRAYLPGWASRPDKPKGKRKSTNVAQTYYRRRSSRQLVAPMSGGWMIILTAFIIITLRIGVAIYASGLTAGH